MGVMVGLQRSKRRTFGDSVLETEPAGAGGSPGSLRTWCLVITQLVLPFPKQFNSIPKHAYPTSETKALNLD